MAGDPLALGQSLDQYLGRALVPSKLLKLSLSVLTRRSMISPASVRMQTRLEFFVEVDADVVHGWS